jgi:ornithine decarboxylase
VYHVSFEYFLFIIFIILNFLADRIIYANPCKQTSYIRYAQEVGVDTMTFDNEQELMKIKQVHPSAK